MAGASQAHRPGQGCAQGGQGIRDSGRKHATLAALCPGVFPLTMGAFHGRMGLTYENTCDGPAFFCDVNHWLCRGEGYALL